MAKLEYERDIDAAYPYVDYPIKDGAVKKTIALNSVPAFKTAMLSVRLARLVF